MNPRSVVRGPGVVPLVLATVFAAASTAPPAGGPAFASPRTVVAAIVIDRDDARLLQYTVKNRPFTPPADTATPRPIRPGLPAQVEVVLYGPDKGRFVQRVDVRGLCLDHGSATPPEVQGDTIRVHRETFLVELPERAGFDQLEIAYYTESQLVPLRRTVGLGVLDAAHFTAAGAAESYAGLVFARDLPSAAASLARLTASTLHWPEEYGDTDIYAVYGKAAETGSRINVVIVPDGYTFSEKATMEAHARALVDAFRTRTPYKEHDPFFNYILVYAYSSEDQTDECDCGIIRDTAFNTGFPQTGAFPCGSSNNRCLYYGWACDTPDPSEEHISQAELRAPADDVTIVMVNTTRYGGCGGNRAVYAAATSVATEIAIHELGHSLAGLADEYGGFDDCGTWTSEVNTSLDAEKGAWPEWIGELGVPREGAHLYNRCIYRPFDNCEMRALSSEFCPVCNQHWALRIFGHPRVNPTAPVAASFPESPVKAYLGQPASYALSTRFAAGPNVTNTETWQIAGPGSPNPSIVATGVTSFEHTWTAPGTYTLTAEVVADTNFVKPVKNAANVDTVEWTIDAQCDPACAPLPPDPLALECSAPGGVPATDPRARTWLNSLAATAACYEPALANDAPALLPSGCAPGSATAVGFSTKDLCGVSSTRTSTVTVVDTTAPSGAITSPAPRACFGPAAVPVVVNDSFADVCDADVARSYAPGPGPGYAGHGDHHVTLTAGDRCGNTATASIDFTIDLVPPAVAIIPPAQSGFPRLVPFSQLFTAQDADGASGGVVHETVALDGCTVYDGLTYGNRNGLLSDESRSTAEEELCRIVRICGKRQWHNPVVSVTATDCGGNVTIASRTFPGDYKLAPWRRTLPGAGNPGQCRVFRSR